MPDIAGQSTRCRPVICITQMINGISQGSCCHRKVQGKQAHNYVLPTAVLGLEITDESFYYNLSPLRSALKICIAFIKY